MSKFINNNLKELEEYTPGEQPQNISEYIKLNTNENPFPPSDRLKKIVTEEAINNLRLYPDPNCKELVDTIAKVYNVDKKNILIGNGSDEILGLAFLGFGEDGAIYPKLSYGFYTVFADLYGIRKKEIPLKRDYYIDIDDYNGKSGMVVIANPNAPTGLELSKEEVEELLEQDPNRIVIIDEAYVDFGGKSSIELTKKHNNLLVVCTFSKSRNLAGARVGFAIGNEEIIKDLNKLKFSFNPYNLNRISSLFAKEALLDKEYFEKCSGIIMENRYYLTESLRDLGFKINDSVANFIFAKCPDSIGGEEYYKYLKKNKVLVRYFPNIDLKDHVRITVGTKYEIDRLLEETKKMLLKIS